jgi:hypothetical protein
MRTEQKNPVTKETTFKEYKNLRQKGKQEAKSNNNNNDISKDDEEVANFIRRLKKGTNDKYRGNFH